MKLGIKQPSISHNKGRIVLNKVEREETEIIADRQHEPLRDWKCIAGLNMIIGQAGKIESLVSCQSRPV